ncbi:hypothetical protein T484DRAFT_1827241 [Baffinella frigidus]|nr:hypothetical protein T484DRAFT_1827241 [Cryptophyta sp. CCMP2293]
MLAQLRPLTALPSLLCTLAQLRSLTALPSLVTLKSGGNPLALLPNYRRRVIALLPKVATLDGVAVLES